MSSHSAVENKLRNLVREDSRYTEGAYHFVFEALDYAMLKQGKHRRMGAERHLTVSELLDGVREFALDEYGPLARVVLESLGIFATEDLGEVVFNMVEKGLLNKQDSDDREQFAEGFSFRDAFDQGVTIEPSW